jgi:Tfp pilus assembly protein PilF
MREAQSWLERAVARDPSLADAWNALGVARIQQGDRAAAVAAWRKAVEEDPTAALSSLNLAMGLEKAGDHRGAVEALERFVPLASGADRAEAERMLRRLQARP